MTQKESIDSLLQYIREKLEASPKWTCDTELLYPNASEVADASEAAGLSIHLKLFGTKKPEHAQLAFEMAPTNGQRDRDGDILDPAGVTVDLSKSVRFETWSGSPGEVRMVYEQPRPPMAIVGVPPMEIVRVLEIHGQCSDELGMVLVRGILNVPQLDGCFVDVGKPLLWKVQSLNGELPEVGERCLGRRFTGRFTGEIKAIPRAKPDMDFAAALARLEPIMAEWRKEKERLKACGPRPASQPIPGEGYCWWNKQLAALQDKFAGSPNSSTNWPTFWNIVNDSIVREGEVKLAVWYNCVNIYYGPAFCTTPPEEIITVQDPLLYGHPDAPKPQGVMCGRCGRSWRDGEPERHYSACSKLKDKAVYFCSTCAQNVVALSGGICEECAVAPPRRECSKCGRTVIGAKRQLIGKYICPECEAGAAVAMSASDATIEIDGNTFEGEMHIQIGRSEEDVRAERLHNHEDIKKELLTDPLATVHHDPPADPEKLKTWRDLPKML
jgi:hypothetical protein